MYVSKSYLCLKCPINMADGAVDSDISSHIF